MGAAQGSSSVDVRLQARATATLNEALQSETGWVRVHAAEAWIALGDGERIRRLHAAELSALENSAFRVGAWRILAVTASSPAERAPYLARIETVFLAPGSADRLQAIESLGKLRHVLRGTALLAARKMEAEVAPPDALFPLWALCVAQEPGAIERLTGALASPDAAVRRRTGLILRWLAPQEPWIRQELARATDAEPTASVAAPYLVSAALWLKVDPARTAPWRARLEDALMTGPANVRLEAAQTLMRLWTPADLGRVAVLLDHAEGDVRIGVAWTILEVLARAGHR
ncbi:MAG: hypothetical protein RIQ93_2113 [Verrucomicrobiota bacterium]|jgi:hypothetical protein